jgi:hypothetical protein
VAKQASPRTRKRTERQRMSKLTKEDHTVIKTIMRMVEFSTKYSKEPLPFLDEVISRCNELRRQQQVNEEGRQ